jgi:hypothetical protein
MVTYSLADLICHLIGWKMLPQRLHLDITRSLLFHLQLLGPHEATRLLKEVDSSDLP